jgi:predicted TPR repeat methyltransferase
VLGRRRGHPDALHFYGILLHETGQSGAGIESIRRSLADAPDNPHAWNNLGNILLQLDEPVQAIAAYERAIGSDPRMADAWYNLGVCRRKMGDPAAAVAALDRALALRPHAPSFYQRGIAHRDLQQPDAAEADFRAALAANAGYAEVYESLGVLLYRQGRIDAAAEVYRAWVENDPRSGTARHMAAAMAAATGAADAPVRAADRYVTEVFDRFAPTFERNLHDLGYRAPQLIAAALAQVLPAGRCAAALDAGCGTGLCGALLRPLAVRLVGVDLSPAMIERAREKRCYDELHVAELCAFMGAHGGEFDAVAAADTLVYFGALSEPFAAAADCLQCGGIFVFTLEKMPADCTRQGYRIEPHGRYSHRLDYVRTALAGAAFELLEAGESSLRRERGEDVAGLVVTARKTSKNT